MELTSPAFDSGGMIPTLHTCDGEDISPPLAWSELPSGTQALAILVTDPDADGFTHWVVTDIPARVRELGEAEGDDAGKPGRNDFGRVGWGGPCPPSGEHRYVFTLYALAEPLGLPAGASAANVRDALETRSLDQTTLTATYARGG